MKIESGEFAVGDTVQLKSGGPIMTLERIGDYSPFGSGGRDQAFCVWFEGTSRKSEVFEFHSIRKADPEPPR